MTTIPPNIMTFTFHVCLDKCEKKIGAGAAPKKSKPIKKKIKAVKK
jgi:hypothetical protein